MERAHSLPLFAAGVFLAYLAALAAALLPAGVLTLLFLAADAVLIQLGLAWLLETQRRSGIERSESVGAGSGG